MQEGPDVSERLVASGRDADILEFAPGLVLRRSRDGRSIAHEARIMNYVGERGYPVPRIEEVRADGTEIVMERLDGRSMLDELARRPWQMIALLGELADLHDRLHAIVAPAWLPEFSSGGAVLHLDLHPLNVMMTSRGPVVIDWPNARAGAPLADVALTYALLRGGHIPLPRPIAQVLGAVRAPMINRGFARRYLGDPEFDQHLAYMAGLKAFDPHLYADEVAAITRLAAGATQTA